MFGGSGPNTKPPIYCRALATGNGPKAPIRRPSVKTPVRRLSSVVVSSNVLFGCEECCSRRRPQPEGIGTALPTVNVVRLPGPVAIEGTESPRVPVPQWVPGLPTHPDVVDLLEDSSFAPCHPGRRGATNGILPKNSTNIIRQSFMPSDV